MAERSADWMAQARRDLDTARWSMQGGFHEWACFQAQQAAEKAAKAVYERLAGSAHGHSVAELLLGLREKVEISDGVVEIGRRLDLYYIPARYPNGWSAGSPQDYFSKEVAEGAIRDTDELLRLCEGLLAG